MDRLLHFLGFPNAVARLRARLGLTQEQLATVFGVTQGRVAQIEDEILSAAQKATYRASSLRFLARGGPLVTEIRRRLRKKGREAPGPDTIIDEELGLAVPDARLHQSYVDYAARLESERDRDAPAAAEAPGWMSEFSPRLSGARVAHAAITRGFGVRPLAHLPYALLLDATSGSGSDAGWNTLLYGPASDPGLLTPETLFVVGVPDRRAPLVAAILAAFAQHYGAGIRFAVVPNRPFLPADQMEVRVGEAWYRPQFVVNHDRGSSVSRETVGIVARCPLRALLAPSAQDGLQDTRYVAIAAGADDLAVAAAMELCLNKALLKHVRGNRADDCFGLAFKVRVGELESPDKPALVEGELLDYWPVLNGCRPAAVAAGPAR